MVSVKSVIAHSSAYKAGILAGDFIVSVNGETIDDVLDYDFYTSDKKLNIVLKRQNEEITVKLAKREYEKLGCEFETYLMDKKQTCRNKCIFCFIDQNPKGMRDSIYFKDDDSRMSFLSGNYITLTNLSEHDVNRIIKMHISPMNISVHTTNPELRVKMMNNKNAGTSLDIIRRFADAGIWMNMQIVLCPDVNDKAELDRTLYDLKKYIPSVKSIAVVPIGLTKHRDGLCCLRGFTQAEALDTINQIEKFQKDCLNDFGERICYPSDEFYLKAKLPVPDEEFYEDYPQLDNGVGMIRSFLSEVKACANDVKCGNRRFSIATGYAAYDCICEAVKILGGNADVYKIRNDFFGESVTVAGLVTGADLINQLSGKDLGEALAIPCTMLRYEQDKFLDGVTLEEVSEKLAVKVIPVQTDGESFAELFCEKFRN